MQSENEKTSPPVIGFIGVGQIGRPIVERLLQAAFDLVLCDINPQATGDFAGRAKVASSSADIARQADIVFACLVTLDAYRDAVLGADGLVHGDRARIYVHIGTTGPKLVRELAETLSGRGIVTVDAAVTGGVAGARAGTLTSMVSGPRAAVDAIEPYLRAYSRKIVNLGAEPGLSQSMKLINNMLSISSLAIAAEAMVFGTKAGLSAETMLEVINSGTGQSNATLTKVPNNILPRSFNVGSALSSVLEDLEAYRTEVKNIGITSDACAAVIKYYREAAEQGAYSDDISTVIRPFERAAGVELKSGA